eukprot:276740_1
MNKDKQINHKHYLKFKEYYWIIQQYEDQFFSVTIQSFITFKSETYEELNDIVLCKARTRLKRLSIRSDDTRHSSPSKINDTTQDMDNNDTNDNIDITTTEDINNAEDNEESIEEFKSANLILICLFTFAFLYYLTSALYRVDIKWCNLFLLMYISIEYQHLSFVFAIDSIDGNVSCGDIIYDYAGSYDLD